MKYVKGSYNTLTADYVAWKQAEDFQDNIRAMFAGTNEAAICVYKLYDINDLNRHAEKDADDVLEANKAKLLNGVANYLGEFETVEVTETSSIKTSIKGFQGEFTLNTDKGRRLFTCKAITAEGPIVSFHWRYIIHVKDLS